MKMCEKCYWRFRGDKEWRYGWPTNAGDGLVMMGRWNGEYSGKDGLADFVVQELTETFDPDESPLERVQRAGEVMEMAMHQLQQVSDTLLELEATLE